MIPRTKGPFVEIAAQRWCHFEDIRGVHKLGIQTSLSISCGISEITTPVDVELDDMLEVLEAMYNRYYIDGET